MSKLLAVFGATGQQGGSIIDYVLKDPDLSKQFKIRAITRDPSKPAAKTLHQKGVEVVAGDLDNKNSLEQALKGVHTVFAMTGGIPLTKQQEITQGKLVADAAVAGGASFIVWSTLPDVDHISGGKYPLVDHFDSKAEVEAYIRKLPIKSAFFAPGGFMQNFAGMMAPQPTGDGSFAISSVVEPSTCLPLIDIADDAGKFVGTILAAPDKYEGKVLSAATKLYSMSEIAEIISEKSGKKVVYQKLPVEVISGFMPPDHATDLVQMLLWFRDFGYYGPETKELVEWTAKQARGELTSFEKFLEKNPLNLK